jgi:biopolymer transport protein ExbD
MAQMETGDGGGKKKGGKVRSKKMSTRIDFTPMVDLGFLLITFFMLTTTLNKPQIMPVVFPEKVEKDVVQDPVKESKVLTLLLGEKDKVYFYNGISDAKLDSTDYSAEGLRKVLLAKKDEVRAAGFPDVEYDFKNKEGEIEKRKRSEAIVLIKPLAGSRYKNVVDTFDEMAISAVAIYMLIEPSDAEIAFVKDPSKPLNFSAEAQATAAGK